MPLVPSRDSPEDSQERREEKKSKQIRSGPLKLISFWRKVGRYVKKPETIFIEAITIIIDCSDLSN